MADLKVRPTFWDRRAGRGLPRPARLHSLAQRAQFLRHDHIQNLPRSGRRSEAKIRDIQVPVGPERHRRRQRQSVGNRAGLAGRIDADDAPRSRSRSRSANGVLEHVHPIARIEGEPDNRREPVRPLLDLSARCDFPYLRHVRANRKRIEVADEEIAMHGDGGRHDVPLAGRDVDHTAHRAIGRHPDDLAVIGLDRVERAADGDHAVPRAVRFEVALFWVGDGIVQRPRAQVRHLGPGPACRVHTDDAVRRRGEAVRAPGTRDQGIEGRADEVDISDAADQRSERGGRLAGRQSGGDRRSNAGR